MAKEICNNCGQELSEENIRLACEDAGMPQEELSFCCPSYGNQPAFRVRFAEYGDGYEDFASREEAEIAKAEYEQEYGEGTAKIEQITAAHESCSGYGEKDQSLPAYWRTA